MKSQHTPGPWSLSYDEYGKLETDSYGEYTSIHSESEFGSVAEVLFKKTNILGDNIKLQEQTFVANARLIASAPELLEALIKAQKDLEQGLILPSTEKLINAVIAKATGEKEVTNG